LWRARKNMVLPVEVVLADGSFLSTIYPSAQARRQRRRGLRVRVVEYQLDGGGAEAGQTVYRLLTTLLEPAQAPAEALARLYAQRWEIEGRFDELRTHLRGGQVVLRSKTPELVEQEFYGLLLAHWAVRGLMQAAAQRDGLDPDQLSFTHAVRVVRRKLAAGPAFSPCGEGVRGGGPPDGVAAGALRVQSWPERPARPETQAEPLSDPQREVPTFNPASPRRGDPVRHT
jgi:hypothetical protein